jgi:hypothetical protein
MDTKYDFDDGAETPIVYVRPVRVAELPEELRAQVVDRDLIYAVHNASGERLALAKDRKLAFMLADQNDCVPVSVH